MKKFLTSSALFIVLASLVYCFGVIAFGRFIPYSFRRNLPYNPAAFGYSYTRFKEADKINKDIDVLVLGPSRAYRGYDPRIFEKYQWTLFNLGSSAQTPIQTAYVLDKYIAKIHPKLVIFEIAPELFNSEGVESMIDFVSNTKLDIELVRLALLQTDIRLYNTLFYRVFTDIFKLNEGLVEENPGRNGDLYVHGGYVQATSRYEGKDNFKAIDYSFVPKQVKAFDHIIRRLQEEKIPYLLLRSPIPPAKYETVTNNSFANGFFSKYGYYRDTNEVLKLPDSCFLDASHLNQSGVHRYNEYVINLIKQTGYLNK